MACVPMLHDMIRSVYNCFTACSAFSCLCGGTRLSSCQGQKTLLVGALVDERAEQPIFVLEQFARWSEFDL